MRKGTTGVKQRNKWKITTWISYSKVPGGCLQGLWWGNPGKKKEKGPVSQTIRTKRGHSKGNE